MTNTPVQRLNWMQSSAYTWMTLPFLQLAITHNACSAVTVTVSHWYISRNLHSSEWLMKPFLHVFVASWCKVRSFRSYSSHPAAGCLQTGGHCNENTAQAASTNNARHIQPVCSGIRTQIFFGMLKQMTRTASVLQIITPSNGQKRKQGQFSCWQGWTP